MARSIEHNVVLCRILDRVKEFTWVTQWHSRASMYSSTTKAEVHVDTERAHVLVRAGTQSNNFMLGFEFTDEEIEDMHMALIKRRRDTVSKEDAA